MTNIINLSNQSIGERLKNIRLSKNIKQSDLSRETSISQSNISNIENNKIVPRADDIIEIADFLNVSIDFILTGKQITTKYQISELEQEMLELFNSFSIFDQHEILGKLKYMKELIDSTSKTPLKKIPVLGQTACGMPIQAIDDFSYYIETDELKADFALIANGDSMSPLINDGDYILVKSSPSLNNGDIGIFQINKTGFSTDEEVTCKYYHFVNNYKIVLKSNNQKYNPLIVNTRKENFKIIGKFVGVVSSEDV